MKFIQNKKNLIFILYIILAFLIINCLPDYFKGDPQFEWLSNELPAANCCLFYELNEESYDETSFEDIKNNAWILNDYNIKYTIKNTETNQLMASPSDISRITINTYKDSYLFFIQFQYDENGNMTYTSSYFNEYYMQNYNNLKEQFYNSYSNIQFEEPKNISITYAIRLHPDKEATSYKLIYPISYYTNSINNQLFIISIIFISICFFIRYDQLWLLETMKKIPIYINISIILITILSISGMISSQLSNAYMINYSKYNIYIPIIFLLYFLHLVSRYLRYLYDKKHKKNLAITHKNNISNIPIDVYQSINNLKTVSIYKQLFIISLMATIVIFILSYIIQNTNPNGEMFFLLLIIFGSIYYLSYRYLKNYDIQYHKLVSATKQLSQGNFDIDIEENLTYFKELQQEFSHIKDGFEKAVNEEVKSERMKTELITNVSHDLKTPLTSMITYIDLLKKDDNTKDESNDYICVIERNALRLKRLIDDLFDITKATTGNIELNLENIDIISLIKQAQFECYDVLNNHQLTIKENYKQGKYILYLDSLKTFRIFENLFNNISKYALPSTRVYIDITEDSSYITIIIKNISAQEMNFTGEEIVERFVRGDKSRNTAGSGLGLAIAKSFTEVQGGQFKIEIDGDLFKAIVSFKKPEV